MKKLFGALVKLFSLLAVLVIYSLLNPLQYF